MKSFKEICEEVGKTPYRIGKTLPNEAKDILRQFDRKKISKDKAVEEIMRILDCKRGSANVIIAQLDNFI